VAQRAWITGRSIRRERVAPVTLPARLLQRRLLRRVELVQLRDGVPEGRGRQTLALRVARSCR
jgi:hypothetical protein